MSEQNLNRWPQWKSVGTMQPITPRWVAAPVVHLSGLGDTGSQGYRWQRGDMGGVST